jgi:1-acyl-sn-glycerol-3-phosphate acyltransferase
VSDAKPKQPTPYSPNSSSSRAEKPRAPSSSRAEKPRAPSSSRAEKPRASAVALSTAFWSYLALSSPPLFAGALVTRAATGAFDRELKWLHMYTSAWAYHYVKLLPLWKTRFSGVHHIQDGKPYVLVANHQSLGDILVLFGLFKHFKWVSKASIFKVPFIGWNMYLNDYVGLVRGDKDSITKMLDDCRAHLRAGSSVMLFPEGTRSTDGELKPFKHGAFSLAKEFGVPVVPIVIDGTRDALPKHGLVFRQTTPVQIRVHVLEPISPDAGEDARALSDVVRSKMLLELAAMRRSEGGTGPRTATDSPLPVD